MGVRRLFPPPHSRWWLDGLRQVVPWLAQRSLGGISQMLRRLDLRYKHGRRDLHSPDLAYDTKLRAIQLARHLAAWRPDRYAFLYQDELTYYRRPAVARAYAARGRDAVLAEQGIGPNRRWRIAGCLDVQTGQHIAWQRAHFGRWVLLAYFRQVEATVKATRPDVRRIFVALDNWPVHFHPDLLAGVAGTAIRLLPLPTYAPWTNPEEKVWRQLAEEYFYQHPFAATAPPDAGWTDLRQTIQGWLDRHAVANPTLLRLAGLYPT